MLKFFVFFVFLTNLLHSNDSSLAESMVSIRTRLPTKFFGDNHFCAGTIIGSKFVLTAAQCVTAHGNFPRKPRDLILVVGSSNRLQPTANTAQFVVRKISIHKDYPTKNIHNLAVLLLKDPIGKNFKPLQLATKAPTYGSECKVAGWGRIYKSGPLAAELIETNVNLSDPKECKKKSKMFDEEYGVICSSMDADGKVVPELCNGDPGGPLVCNDELTGVISWVLSCEDQKYPGLYASIYFHRDWIQRVMESSAFGPQLLSCFSLATVTCVLLILV